MIAAASTASGVTYRRSVDISLPLSLLFRAAVTSPARHRLRNSSGRLSSTEWPPGISRGGGEWPVVWGPSGLRCRTGRAPAGDQWHPPGGTFRPDGHRTYG